MPVPVPTGMCCWTSTTNVANATCSCVLGNIDGLKPGWTRLNLAPWATDDEVEFLLDAIEFVAAHGERFLPLY